MRALIEVVSFRTRVWDDVTAEARRALSVPVVPGHSTQYPVMGDALEMIIQAADRTREEGRFVMVQAVFDRT